MEKPFTSLISVQELVESATPSWRIFDCRFRLADPAAGRRAYAEGHLPDALFLDLEEDLSGPTSGLNGRHPLPDPQHLAAKLGSLGVGPDTQVVAYDDTGGMFASRLWWLLRWLGHGKVAVLDGGLQAWAACGKALTTAIPEPTAARFEARLQRDMKVNADYVLSHLDDPEVVIIDARSPDRFRGENETLDPVGGHIPGSVNWSFEENLDIDGTFLPPEALRENFQALLKGRAPHQVIHSCGSGVTACHNILAMEVAGLPGSRLYPGSWSEWITDPSRPVALGE